MRVILDRRLFARIFIFAQIDAEGNGVVIPGQFLQPAPHALGSITIKTHAIDQTVLVLQSKESRFGIAALGSRRDCAQLQKRQTHAGKTLGSASIFIETSGETNWVRQISDTWNLRIHSIQKRRQTWQRQKINEVTLEHPHADVMRSFSW
jgi:hypothetical protein